MNRARIKLRGKMPRGVDRMCLCGHTLGAHPQYRDGECMDAKECGCDGFVPAEFANDEVGPAHDKAGE